MKVKELIKALGTFDPEMLVGLVDWNEQYSDPLVEWGGSDIKVMKWHVWKQVGSSAEIEKVDIEAVVLGSRNEQD